MIAKSHKVLVPVLVWIILCSGLFLTALAQQRLGTTLLPLVTMSSAFPWIGAMILAYLVLVWPISLERMVERFARTAAGQNSDYYVMALQEPGLLLLYCLPVLVAAAAFGDKGFSEILQFLALAAAVGTVTLAHFSLGFFVHGNLARLYFLLAGLICVAAPLVNVVFHTLLGKGPSFLGALNPFHSVFSISASGGAIGAFFLVPVILYTVLGLVLMAVPLLTALPPKFYDDIPWG